MFTKQWLIDTGERLIAVAATTLLSFGASDGLDLLSIHWPSALSITGGAVAAELLRSLIAGRVGDRDTASMVPTYGRHARHD